VIGSLINRSIDSLIQSINLTYLYSAVCRERIEGA